MPASTEKIDKVVITNSTALNAKYGSVGEQEIMRAVQNLVAEDGKRGMVTRLYCLDDKTAMGGINASAVDQPADPQQNKDAVDAIYKAVTPDYLMILGSIDIVPLQDLENVMYAQEGDMDELAPGDLPYACEAGYSRQPRDFCGPTRILGRLPDLTGATDPSYLVGLLETAATYEQYSLDSYHPYFGIAAEKFKGSTALSLTAAFGDAKSLETVPPEGENWTNALLTRLSHFVNCHGALNDSRFFGQPADEAHQNEFPVALDAAYLNNRITKGTVVATECCYGAQLFDPTVNGGQAGMANTYLMNKAYGFFGSTTIAYGPDDYNDAADLICQYFMRSLLRGASVGRAALEARQEFLHSASLAEASNLKTIAQFNLYGDPSITPIKLPHTAALAHMALTASVREARAERRYDLFSRGLALSGSQPILKKLESTDVAAKLSLMEKTAAEHGITMGAVLTFKVEAPPNAKAIPLGLMAKEPFPGHVHIIFSRGDRDMKGPRVFHRVVLVVKEVDGKIVSVKKLFSR
jgi:hypothetical protein